MPTTGSDSSGFALVLPGPGEIDAAPEAREPHTSASAPALQGTSRSAEPVTIEPAGPQSVSPPTERGAKHLLASLATPAVDPGAPVAIQPQPTPTALLTAQDFAAAAALEPATSANPNPAAVAQVTPAVVSLATRRDGTSEMTVSLHPHDLGQVEIHLVRANDGTTAVTITASQPGTLQELSQNVHHLHAALDAANVSADGRTMTFMASPSDTAGQSPRRNDSAALDGSTGQDRGGASNGQGESQGQSQSQSWQQSRQRHDGNDANGTYNPLAPIASRRRWQLGGLNITA